MSRGKVIQWQFLLIMYWTNQLITCRDIGSQRRATLILTSWLQQENGLKRVTKKLKMVGSLNLFTWYLVSVFLVPWTFANWFVHFAFLFVKLKSKELFKWWIFMTYRSQKIRMFFFPRTKVEVVMVVLREDTGDSFTHG